jgi:hypothetical protein
MSKRIKHNDLLPWFQEDHAQLPKAYVKSCEKFFRELGKKPQASSSKQRGLTKKEERLGWITRGHEPQAASYKQQATNRKRQAVTCTNKKKDIDINHE